MKGKEESWPNHSYKADCSHFSDWVHIIVGGKGAPTEAQMGSTTKWLKENNLWNELKLKSEDLVDEIITFSKLHLRVYSGVLLRQFQLIETYLKTHQSFQKSWPLF